MQHFDGKIFQQFSDRNKDFNHPKNSFYVDDLLNIKNIVGVSHHGIVANMFDCNLIGSEFKLQSYYWIHFWTNTLEKDMNPLIHPQLWDK